MSKYVKNLITNHVRNRLQGINDAVLVNVIGLGSIPTYRLRAELRSKNISLLVVKNSLAAQAVAGTPLDGMFEDIAGSAAICWGSSDIVSLAKEITRLVDVKEFEKLEARGGLMDGARLTAAQVAEVSKWPSREEQLSLLMGQILGPGGRLASQLSGPGGALASQVKEKAKEAEGDTAEAVEGDKAEAIEGDSPQTPPEQNVV